MAKRTPKTGAASKTESSFAKPLPRDSEALRVLLRAVEQALRYLGPLHRRQAARLEAWHSLLEALGRRGSNRKSKIGVEVALKKLAALRKGTEQQIAQPVFPWRVIEPFVGARKVVELDRRIQAGRPAMAVDFAAAGEGGCSETLAAFERILPQVQDATDALGGLVRLFEDFQSHVIERLSERRTDSDSARVKKPRQGRDVKPEWNRHRGELSFHGGVVLEIRSVAKAKNMVAILDAFQAQKWPERIEDPFPGPPDSQRLREAIQNLNIRLKVLRFEADGSGEGIRWKLAERPRKSRARAARRP